MNNLIKDQWQELKRKVPFWGRIVMNREIDQELSRLSISELDALEISGWAHSERPFRSYQARMYPEFDVCTKASLEAEADIVFCEQVLEHTPDPQRAVDNIYALLRPGGFAVISVPFLVRVHNEPSDYWRFTPAGLRVLVERAGFEVVSQGDWGNRASVVANLWFWCPYVPGLQSMRRNHSVPLVVWTIVRKTQERAR
jgi:SAM-dependent methyltransferase